MGFGEDQLLTLFFEKKREEERHDWHITMISYIFSWFNVMGQIRHEGENYWKVLIN